MSSDTTETTEVGDATDGADSDASTDDGRGTGTEATPSDSTDADGRGSRTGGDVALEIDGLTKRFGGLTAVDDLSFEVRENEILGFIGPNGAGKSTVFNCIMGVYAPSDGRVSLHGEDVTGADTHAIVNRGLARVSQESNPIPGRTAAENIKIFTLPNSLLSFRGGAGRDEIERIAARVGIAEQLDVLPGSMAHADTRRLEIAKAVATDPDTLLLDEPFAGMNQAEIRELSERIRAFREDGMTIVVVDHNMKGLMALVDRVIVLNEGTKIADGTPEDVANDERVQQAYLAGSETGFETDTANAEGTDTQSKSHAETGVEASTNDEKSDHEARTDVDERRRDDE